LNPYNISDKAKWCSSQILYSALIVEDPDNDMQGLVNFRLRDLRTMEIMKVSMASVVLKSLEMRLSESYRNSAELRHERAYRKSNLAVFRREFQA